VKLIIPGQTPSKKNAKRIVRAKGRMLIISSKLHEEWHKNASQHLETILSKYTPDAIGKVTINYTFYVKDNRRRDVSNMLESINDLLVDCGVLEDDDWKHVRIGSADAEVDKENPRAEVTIKPDRR